MSSPSSSTSPPPAGGPGQPRARRRQPRRRDAVQAGLPVPGHPAGGRGQRAGQSRVPRPAGWATPRRSTRRPACGTSRRCRCRDPAWVRSRTNLPVARERIAPIDVPILVMGRDDDHLQGMFRLSYELLAEAGKEATWVTWDHPLHGYIFPCVGRRCPAAGPGPGSRDRRDHRLPRPAPEPAPVATTIRRSRPSPAR